MKTSLLLSTLLHALLLVSFSVHFDLRQPSILASNNVYEVSLSYAPSSSQPVQTIIDSQPNEFKQYDKSIVSIQATKKNIISTKAVSTPQIISSSSKSTAAYSSQVNISQQVNPADYARNPIPEYPMQARRRGLEGTVELLVDVKENGRVKDLKVQKSSGFDILDHAAAHAVTAWVFTPAQIHGVPIAAKVVVPITFKLR